MKYINLKLKPIIIDSIKSKEITKHVQILSLMFVNSFINNVVVYMIIGLINRRFSFINTIFVMYPATEEYARNYAYSWPWYRNTFRWSPCPAGLFYQNGKYGIVTMISAIEDDIKDFKNIDNLKLLIVNAEKKRKLLNAKQITYSGVLPGIFYKNQLSTSLNEATVTVNAVISATKLLERKINYSSATPLIILGSGGFIGSKIVQMFPNREIHKIDINNKGDFPIHLQGREAILINLTQKTALREYLPFFWKEIVLLNETYPEPSINELQILKSKSCEAYHVVGVKAKTYPSFPKAYKGGIPCCAAWLSPDMEVIIRKL
jgi:hypothetical protein